MYTLTHVHTKRLTHEHTCKHTGSETTSVYVVYVCMYLEDRVPAEFTYLQTDRQTERRRGRQAESKHTCTNRQTNGRTDRQTGSQTDRVYVWMYVCMYEYEYVSSVCLKVTRYVRVHASVCTRMRA